MKKIVCSCGCERWTRICTQTEVAECTVTDYDSDGLEDDEIDVSEEFEPVYEYTCSKCGKGMVVE